MVEKSVIAYGGLNGIVRKGLSWIGLLLLLHLCMVYGNCYCDQAFDIIELKGEANQTNFLVVLR